MSGSKIDVEASEGYQNAKQQPDQQNDSDSGSWPHRTLEMTWREACYCVFIQYLAMEVLWIEN